ncbi:MAG TPA: hypothetical protein VNQ73_06645 [Ilumatobacter sp.]|nr:hypothetical protein [Ilumatobacter sp.]
MNEHFIPNHRIPNPGPHIATPATTRLLDELDDLARRHPEVTALVVAIRQGDDAQLLEVVRKAQLGDHDAALIALGGLLPLLCKIVLGVTIKESWQDTIDDYLAVAYLTIREATDITTAEHLASRIGARVRRRHARQSERKWANELPTNALDFPESSVEIDDVVLARAGLFTLARAAATGIIQPRQWDGIRALARAELGGPALKPTERRRLARARHTLAEHPQLRFAA